MFVIESEDYEGWVSHFSITHITQVWWLIFGNFVFVIESEDYEEWVSHFSITRITHVRWLIFGNFVFVIESEDYEEWVSEYVICLAMTFKSQLEHMAEGWFSGYPNFIRTMTDNFSEHWYNRCTITATIRLGKHFIGFHSLYYILRHLRTLISKTAIQVAK